jgi:hypothetical protein
VITDYKPLPTLHKQLIIYLLKSHNPNQHDDAMETNQEIERKELSALEIIALQSIELYIPDIQETEHYSDWLHMVEKFKNDDEIPTLFLDSETNQILRNPSYSKKSRKLNSKLSINKLSQSTRELEMVFFFFM